MTEQFFPKDLIVTIPDFRNSGWREAIKNTGIHGYSKYNESFSRCARNATETGDEAKGKVLWLLAMACSMLLEPESVNEPFQPMIKLQESRSAVPDDFSDTDLSFFENILPEIDDFRLKARIADILWLVKKPRKVEYALCAIDSYQKFPLEIESLVRDDKEAWQRAIRLALLLGKGALERIEIIRDTIFLKFKAADFEKKFHALILSDLLEMAKIDEDKAKYIATKLEAFAQHAKEDKDLHCAREYYEGSIRWLKTARNESDAYRICVELAETYISEADISSANEKKGNLVSGFFIESAIKTYRRIPKKERGALKVVERLEELQKRLGQTNKLGLHEMNVIKSSRIDVSQTVEQSRKFVLGRKFPEVLIAFANIHPIAQVDLIRKNSESIVLQYPFSHLFITTHLTSDGRVAARTPGIGIGGIDSPETQKVVWKEMIWHHGHHVRLVVQSVIWPAWHVISKEHRLTASILESLCRISCVVPNGREGPWARGLFSGFDNDFIISTHLLIPQLEHLVRILLKQNGIKTTTLDSNGIETENGLSTLLDNPDIEKSLDKNLVFELKALLADPMGPNLRNELAHGLLEEYVATSEYAVYLWWICLRLVINSIPWKVPDKKEPE